MAASSAVPLPSFETAAPRNRLLPIFDAFRLPKSGKPDFGGRPPQDEVGYCCPRAITEAEHNRCTIFVVATVRFFD
jgi:hypothetical protein